MRRQLATKAARKSAPWIRQLSPDPEEEEGDEEIDHEQSFEEAPQAHIPRAARKSAPVPVQDPLPIGWQDTIFDILSNVENPGVFATSGRMGANTLQPGLDITGLGKLSVPLVERDAQALKTLCTLAPYGKGESTLHDASVRHTWQMEPSQFTINNPAWNKDLQALVPIICSALGTAKEGVSAELYKLLLYEPGSHFKPHRDSEKAEGMWGTMVVLLPSEYEVNKPAC